MQNVKSFVFSFAIVTVAIARTAAQAQQVSNMEYSQQHSYQVGNIPQSTGQYPAANMQSQASTTLKIGIVNTKRCLEESKLGKQEQANFEKMKNQMESVLRDKESLLEEIEGKLNDEDYMDSISEEAESELKRKKRTIRNEGMQLQNQYMQTLQQANVKIVQKLTEAISKASALVAQDPVNHLDAIFSDDSATYYAPKLDISSQVIAKMNASFDEEKRSSGSKLP